MGLRFRYRVDGTDYVVIADGVEIGRVWRERHRTTRGRACQDARVRGQGRWEWVQERNAADTFASRADAARDLYSMIGLT